MSTSGPVQLIFHSVPMFNFLHAADEHKKKWLRRGSHAHEALKGVVLNKRLLKDTGKLNSFCHTGGLEVYHSVMTMFCPKREHFP